MSARRSTEASSQSSVGLLAAIFGKKEGSSTRSASSKKTARRPTIPATKVNQLILAQSDRGNTRVVIDIAKQRAYLLVNERIAMESPISSARPGKYTPRGTFSISERVRSGKISTIYGVGMPYWMRLSGSVIGVHAGYLPGYPASAGCVRLPSDAAQLIYDHTRYGTKVTITSSWTRA